MLPSPVVDRVGDFLVVRDDLILGGTKRRVVDRLIAGYAEVVYASPAYGYAQVALAHAGNVTGTRVTIFTAARKQWHPRTQEAIDAGARIVGVPYGYLSNVQSKAKAYAAQTGALLLPFGFDTPAFTTALSEVARSLPVTPSEVWSVAGSGTLSRALQQAWPDARCFAVQVGRTPDIGRALLVKAPEPFEQDATEAPPFPSTSNFDAKAWRFFSRQASPGALFWNVAR